MYLVRTECCCLLQHGFSIVKDFSGRISIRLITNHPLRILTRKFHVPLNTSPATVGLGGDARLLCWNGFLENQEFRIHDCRPSFPRGSRAEPSRQRRGRFAKGLPKAFARDCLAECEDDDDCPDDDYVHDDYRAMPIRSSREGSPRSRDSTTLVSRRPWQTPAQ